MWNTPACAGILGEFWEGLGGFQPADPGVFPQFRSDITIRGGIIKIYVTNEDTATPIKVNVYLVRSTPSPIGATVLPFMSPVNLPIDFDPTLIPDFAEYGKVVTQKEGYLLPGGNPIVCSWRLSPQKLDQGIWATNRGSQLIWFVQAGHIAGTGLAASDLQVVSSWNMSFSGDAIT